LNDVVTKVPLKGIRAMIADKMAASLANSAQLTHHATANFSKLLSRKAALLDRGVKVSVEDLLIAAVVQTISRHSSVNGTLEQREICLNSSVHLSIAMALPGNILVAPTIFNAQELDLLGLREARKDLSKRAASNALTASEMTKGTFTVSNLGLSRVHHFTPILNTPQIAILGIGCTEMRAVVDNSQLVLQPFVGLSLTFDHRAIDGAPAADFISDLCRTIENG
jgi:pyruvate/2-oxoglutarate dehydrogenase complex dihydrolipoamide acyltransferase (E2) component